MPDIFGDGRGMTNTNDRLAVRSRKTDDDDITTHNFDLLVYTRSDEPTWGVVGLIAAIAEITRGQHADLGTPDAIAVLDAIADAVDFARTYYIPKAEA